MTDFVKSVYSRNYSYSLKILWVPNIYTVSYYYNENWSCECVVCCSMVSQLVCPQRLPSLSYHNTNPAEVARISTGRLLASWTLCHKLDRCFHIVEWVWASSTLLIHRDTLIMHKPCIAAGFVTVCCQLLDMSAVRCLWASFTLTLHPDSSPSLSKLKCMCTFNLCEIFTFI